MGWSASLSLPLTQKLDSINFFQSVEIETLSKSSPRGTLDKSSRKYKLSAYQGTWNYYYFHHYKVLVDMSLYEWRVPKLNGAKTV